MSRDNRKNKKKHNDDHFEEGNLTVYVDRPEDFERAVRLFKKLMKRTGILEEVVERQAFTKPSDKKRKKKRDNKYKNSTKE